MPGAATDLILRDGDAEVTIRPGRGAIVSRFTVGGEPILFLDQATLDDPAKNVRGGVPILFPCAGPLAGGAFVHRGARYEMRQHGFAREVPFTVAQVGPREATLVLESDAHAHARFPFDFRLALTYRAAGRALAIEARAENRSDEPMPLHFGLHPYFAVADRDKPRTRIDCSATRAWDNLAKRAVPFSGFELTAAELDLHLYDHGSPRAALERADGRRITLACSDELQHWLVWTLAGRDFVCLEPWTAPIGALNTGQGLLHLAPGEARTLTVEIAVA
jgi:galactose mutarotase-like enzyme